MTTTAATVEQLMLPGQAAAPPGPVDVSGMYVFHFAFRRDLDLLPQVVRATPVDDRVVWAAIAKRWHAFAAVLHHHHSAEDVALWPLLLERASDAERETLDAMESEHAQIDPLLTAIETILDSVKAGHDRREQLAAVLEQAGECVGAHLGHEEADAMALVQKYLSQREWDRLEKKDFAKDQALKDLAQMLPWMLHQFPAGALADLWKTAPAPMKVIWLLTRKRFERGDALVRTHVPA